MGARLQEKARDGLLQLIAERACERIGRLPSERSLSSLLSLSRGTLDKAISQLVDEGVLLRRQGSGTYIVGVERSTRKLSIGIGARNPVRSDSHFTKILNGLKKSAKERNVEIQIFEGMAAPSKRGVEGGSAFDAIESGLLDGFMAVSRMPLDVVARLKGRTPFLMLNNIVEDDEVVCVLPDYVKAGHLAARHLIAQGHKNLLYVADTLTHPECWKNLCGIQLALEEAGLEPGRLRRLAIGRNYDYMKKYLQEFVSEHPEITAIVTRHDRFAALAVRTLEAMGRKIPEDVSTLGIGSQWDGLQTSRPLSMVDTRLDEASEAALTLLCGMARGERPDTNIHLIQPRLLERETVCKFKS